MEFIKGNNNSAKTYIKVIQILPTTAEENDIVLLENNGIYEYKNNQWNLLISFIQSGETPIIGEIKASIGPQGSDWLLCDGSTFSSTTYPQLYSLLGSTTLPDFREVIPVGIGQNSTNTIPDHDVFTLGQKKDWNLQTHFHCKTETNHTHSWANGCVYSHTHPIITTLRTFYSCPGAYVYFASSYNTCTKSSGACNWSPGVVSTASWCSSPSIGNPSSGTGILRVNSYGVNFYIRAK